MNRNYRVIGVQDGAGKSFAKMIGHFEAPTFPIIINGIATLPISTITFLEQLIF
jgi:hypothetical protein